MRALITKSCQAASVHEIYLCLTIVPGLKFPTHNWPCMCEIYNEPTYWGLWLPVSQELHNHEHCSLQQQKPISAQVITRLNFYGFDRLMLYCMCRFTPWRLVRCDLYNGTFHMWVLISHFAHSNIRCVLLVLHCTSYSTAITSTLAWFINDDTELWNYIKVQCVRFTGISCWGCRF